MQIDMSVGMATQRLLMILKEVFNGMVGIKAREREKVLLLKSREINGSEKGIWGESMVLSKFVY